MSSHTTSYPSTFIMPDARHHICITRRIHCSRRIRTHLTDSGDSIVSTISTVPSVSTKCPSPTTLCVRGWLFERARTTNATKDAPNYRNKSHLRHCVRNFILYCFIMFYFVHHHPRACPSTMSTHSTRLNPCTCNSWCMFFLYSDR